MTDTGMVSAGVYRCLSELWCSPQDMDGGKIRGEAEGIVHELRGMDDEGAGHLMRFLSDEAISEENYVELFELDPKCALYLGSHAYAEPKTCAQAGVSERNDYMIDLLGIYKHFGLQPDGKELPDYLPAMLEFLALTADRRSDPVRKKLVTEYMLPFMPAVRARLEELKTPYLYLMKACERILTLEGGQAHVG